MKLDEISKSARFICHSPILPWSVVIALLNSIRQLICHVADLISASFVVILRFRTLLFDNGAHCAWQKFSFYKYQLRDMLLPFSRTTAITLTLVHWSTGVVRYIVCSTLRLLAIGHMQYTLPSSGGSCYPIYLDESGPSSGNCSL